MHRRSLGPQHQNQQLQAMAKRIWPQLQQQAFADQTSGSKSSWWTPKFALEPPTLVEYSNSTGTTIHCRPSGAINHQQPMQHSNNNNNHPHLHLEQQQQQQPQVRLSWRLADGDTQVAPQSSLVSHQEPQIGGAFVRADGALVLRPFAASHFKPEVHSALYRCCLSGPLGTLCSGPVQTRAVIDSQLNLEVFDELAPLGSLATLRCQAPSHLIAHLDFIAWLKDDKLLAPLDELQLARHLRQWHQRQQQQQQQNKWPLDPYTMFLNHSADARLNQQQQHDSLPAHYKHLLTRTGELLVRNASKSDAGSYKCRARHKLTGQVVTSQIGGQLVVLDPQQATGGSTTASASSSSLPVNHANEETSIVFARENSDALLCAKFPLDSNAHRFLWSKLDADNQRQEVATDIAATSLSQPMQFRQFDSCLSIGPLQADRHAGQYICKPIALTHPEQRQGNSALNGPDNFTAPIISERKFHLFVQQATRLSAQLRVSGGGTGNQIKSHPQQPQVHLVPVGARLQLTCAIQSKLLPAPNSIVWLRDAKVIATATLQADDVDSNESAGSPSGGRATPVVDWMTTSGEPQQVDEGPVAGGGGLREKFHLLRPNILQVSNFDASMRAIYQCQVFHDSLALANPAAKLEAQKTLLGQLLRSNNLTSNHHHHHHQQLASAVFFGQFQHEFWPATAAVSSGWVQLSAQLSKPQLVSGFATNQSLERGASAFFECAASGLPAPKIFWFLDEFLLTSTVQPTNNNNNNGDQADDFEINLSQQISVQQTPPHNYDDHQELNAQLVQLIWQLAHGKRRHQMLVGASSEQFKITENSQQEQVAAFNQSFSWSRLVVGNVTQLASGRYKCLALNSLGYVTHSGHLLVVEETELMSGQSGRTGPMIKLRHFQPNNLTLASRQASVKLQCPLIGFPLKQVDWFLGGQKLPQNQLRQRVEQVLSGCVGGTCGQLELLNADPQTDSGLYTCRAHLERPPGQIGPTNATSYHQSNSTAANSNLLYYLNEQDSGLVGQVQVNFVPGPLIDSQSLPEVVQATEGMRTKLICSVVEGGHPMEIKWLRRSEGAGSKFVQLQQVRLQGVELMQNQLISERTSEQGANVASELISLHNLEDSALMTFKQIKAHDEGVYFCLAYNQVGVALRQVRVSVSVAPLWSVEPPSEVALRLGSRLQLDCLAHGNPLPIIKWRRKWSQAEFADILASSLRHRQLANGTLIVDQVEPSDGGLYLCAASNGIGSGLSKLINLQVQVPPHFAASATVASAGTTTGGSRGGSQVVVGQLGRQVALKCLAHGDQPMVVGWRKGQTEVIDLMHDRRQRKVSESRISAQSFESQLIIDQLRRDDSGHYECIASNEFGTEELSFLLVVQEPPEAPQVMRPIRASARAATIVFKLPFAGNSLIRRYAIHYKHLQPPQSEQSSDRQDRSGRPSFWFGLAGGSRNESLPYNHYQRSQADSNTGWQQTLVDAPSLEGSVHSMTSSNQQQQQQLVQLNLCCLKPFSRYSLRVAAINDIGQSDLSRPVNFQTDEEAIGGPPLDVSVEPTGAHSLKVRWRAPARKLQNGLIRGYYIGYKSITNPGSGGGGGQLTGKTAAESTFVANSGSEQVVVAGAGGVGGNFGDLAEQFQYKNVQTLDNSAASAILAASFEENSSTVGAENLQDEQHRLQHHQQNGTSSVQVYSTYLTNLRRKTSYSVMVQAYNKIGAGPRSDQTIVSTLDAAPPMSPVMRLLSVSYNSAQIEWATRRFSSPPSRAHSPTKTNQHQVVVGDGKSLDRGSGNGRKAVELVNSEGSSATSGGQVEMETFVGGYDESEEEEAEGDDDDPQAFYTVNLRPEMSADEWQQRRLTKRRHQNHGHRQSNQFSLDNLRCGNKYVAFMTATNSLGQSEPGETIKFNTMGGAPVAPKSVQDFLLVNVSSVVLRLEAWHNAGCPINAFLIKYKPTSANKWIVLEHQVFPAIQTVTLAGNSMFSTKPQLDTVPSRLTAATTSGKQTSGAIGPAAQASGGGPNHGSQQTLDDFLIRNLNLQTSYKLFVEANSEAGTTSAEFDFETANFTATLVAVTVNGLIATPHDESNGRDSGKRSDGPPALEASLAELDFSFGGNGGGQSRVSSTFGGSSTSPWQRYTFGVWSLTICLIIVSIFMATATLIIGVRSLFRLRPLKSRSRDNMFASMLCCSHGSSSSSASNSHSNSNSDESSSAATCYQMATNDIAPTGRHHQIHHSMSDTNTPNYCTLPHTNQTVASSSGSSSTNHYHGPHLILSDCADTPTISGRITRGETVEETAAELTMQSCANGRQMVASSSLSTLAAGRPFVPMARHTHTLGAAHLVRRAEGAREQIGGDEQYGTQQYNAATSFQRATGGGAGGAHFFATLGRQHHNQQLQQSVVGGSNFEQINVSNQKAEEHFEPRIYGLPGTLARHFRQGGTGEQAAANLANYHQMYPTSLSSCAAATATSGYGSNQNQSFQQQQHLNFYEQNSAVMDDGNLLDSSSCMNESHLFEEQQNRYLFEHQHNQQQQRQQQQEQQHNHSQGHHQHDPLVDSAAAAAAAADSFMKQQLSAALTSAGGDPYGMLFCHSNERSSGGAANVSSGSAPTTATTDSAAAAPHGCEQNE